MQLSKTNPYVHPLQEIGRPNTFTPPPSHLAYNLGPFPPFRGLAWGFRYTYPFETGLAGPPGAPGTFQRRSVKKTGWHIDGSMAGRAAVGMALGWRWRWGSGVWFWAGLFMAEDVEAAFEVQ